MRGSVVKRGNGYSIVVELERDPITGKRRQKWHSGFRTKRDAERALSDLVGSVHAGTYVEPTKQTLGEYIREWLVAVKPTIRPSTHHSYGRNLQLHVLPLLGAVQLRRIDAGMLNGAYASLLADGRKNYAAGGLSPRTVRYIHAIVHRALRDAVKWGRLAGNPATPPTHPRPGQAARSRSRGRPTSCAPSWSEPAGVGTGPRTSCSHNWIAARGGVGPALARSRSCRRRVGRLDELDE